MLTYLAEMEEPNACLSACIVSQVVVARVVRMLSWVLIMLTVCTIIGTTVCIMLGTGL